MEFIPGLEENTNKGGELACDIDNVTTISFTPTTSKSEIRKEDIADFGDEGFLYMMCFKHLKYELKAGNNFVVEMSAGAYEILKGEIHKILNSTDENSLAVVQKQDGVEEAGLTVDSCYRVYNRKQNGQAGSVLKFSINLYHTSCSMNVNGKRVDIFINDIFDKLCEKIRKEYCEVQLLNNSIHTCISQMKKYSSKVIQKSITNSDNRQGSHQKDNETSLNIYNRNNQNVELQGAESDTSICPSCRKYVEDGIGCDRCDYWYHYECENISKNIGSEELKHIEYICRFCNDDMLYESRNYMECDEEQHNPPEDSSTDVETYQIHNIESIQEIQDQSLENNNTENIKEILIEEKEAIKTLNPDDQNEDQKMLPEATEDETLVKRVISPIQPIIKMDTKSQEKKASGQSYENSQNIDKTTMQSTDKKKGSKSSTGTKRSDKDEIIVSQKTRILNLENEIKHMRTVIETIKTQNDQPNQNQTRTDNTTRIDNNQQEWMAHNNMKEMLLEHRLRAIEAQMTQNMCIQTALTTQIALQVKNHPPTNPYMCTGNFPSHPHLMNHGIPQYTHTAYTNQYVPTTNIPMYMPTGMYNQFAMPTEMHNPYTMPTGMQMQGPYTMPTGRQMQSSYTIPTYINQQQTSGVYIPTAPSEVLQRQQGQYQHHNLSNTHINPNIGQQNQRRMNATSHPLNPEPIQQTTKPGLLPHPQNFNKNMNHTGQQNQKNAVRANTIQKQQNINTQRERDRDISIKSKIKTLDKRTHNQGLTGTLNQSQRMDTHNEINIPSQDIEKHQNTLTEHLSCTHPTSDNLKVQTINDTSETDKEQGNFRVLAQESRPPDQEQATGKEANTEKKKKLSREESNLIISEGEKIGFERMKGVKDEYRSAQRITLNNPDVAQILWDRIKDYLKPIEFTETKDPKSQHIHGIPFLLKGKWEPCGLNNIFRLCRYYPGGHFAPHYDGFYAKSSNERSLKTFMLYLNNEFQDGCTQFVNENQTLYKDANGKYCAEEKNILERIHPHPGMALLFNHQRLHEGQKVRDGTKYILRTDIMYQRCGDKTINNSEEKALQLLQEAERLEGMGDCMKAAEFYRKAFKLSPALENCH